MSGSYDYSAFLLDEDSKTITKAQKRWRVAYAAIYFSRAMISLGKEVTSKRNKQLDSKVQVHVPCSILDVEASGIVSRSFIDQARLMQMVKDKDMTGLEEFGGVTGIASGLGTSLKSGIGGDEEDVSLRRGKFGSNTYHRQPAKGLFYFVVDAFKDTTIVILLVCAALALGFGIKAHGPGEGWYEDGCICVAVFLVVLVSAVSDFRQEIQFHKLSKISSNIKVEVLRDERRQEVSIFDIVVGDVVFLKIGDQVPADGLFLDGHSLLVDESSMTGESDHLEVDSTSNPFLFSGSKIADGFGRMLVTSVGMSTSWGEMMSSISQGSTERTPLQARLGKLTLSIGKVGLTVAFLVLSVLMIRYFTGNTKDENNNREYIGGLTKSDDIVNSMVRIVAAAVTIVVVAIPGGLLLAVMLTLAYSMKRKMADQAMVRKLSACETLESATIICTDEERMQKVDTVRVMTRSSPLDKLMMVQCLKQKGHVVAVTGDGTNDAPALREADIGLSMGIQGTEVAKESSDIVLLDDNFTSVATVLRRGRCVYNNIQKFKGVVKNRLFIGIVAITIVHHLIMVEFLKKFTDTEKLNWWQWLACIVTAAAISWPIGWFVKCTSVPDTPLVSYRKKSRLGSKKIAINKRKLSTSRLRKT